MRFHIIETERPQHASEFFFEYHENIGLSSEFKRLIEYINKNSNLKIVPSNRRAIEQLAVPGRQHCNYVIYPKDLKQPQLPGLEDEIV